VVVPEAATLYHAHGARLPFGTPPSTCGRIDPTGRNILWEALLNELKRSLESRALDGAVSDGTSTVVLCDRGIFDSRAYLPSSSAWKAMLNAWGTTEHELAPRYDHVFHMCPCPRDAYTLANGARRETYEEALSLDRKTWDAWEGTHSAAHTVVGTRDISFEAKLQSLTQALEAKLLAGDAPTIKRSGWSLPPRELIALADTVAASPDLSYVAPAVTGLLRRVQRIDRMPHDERAYAAEACHRWLRRSAAALGSGRPLGGGSRILQLGRRAGEGLDAACGEQDWPEAVRPK